MATAQNRPAQQLFQQLFSQPAERKAYKGLEGYLKKGGSIFPLVEQGAQALVEAHGLSDEDAEAFIEQANALAIYVRRHYIEDCLFGNSTTVAGPSSGLLSMVEGPSFPQLFPLKFDEFCPPEALESFFSPVAYLIDLLDWIDKKIEPKGATGKFPLRTRRTDLEKLLIDANAVHQPVSAVDIIIPVLESFIRSNEPAATDLEAELLCARYPNGLPYFQPMNSLNHVTRHNGLSVGEVVRLVDLAAPYFLQPHAPDPDAPRAFIQASRLSFYQRQMLTEAAHFTAGGTDAQALAFYARHFGTVGAEWQQYKDVTFICERTKLDSLQLEALLSVRSFAPIRSPNVPAQPGETLPPVPTGTQSGSVYINAGATPAVDIEFVATATPTLHRLKNVTHPQMDRLNRQVRLSQWLELAPEQVDALLAAMIAAAKPANTTYVITEEGVQALGLFQTLREHYGCTAEDFAALIHQVSVYGRGETLSLFDRVFNPHGDYQNALHLDNTAFDPLPPAGQTEPTINQLCSGLGIDLLTYSYLAQAVAQAQGQADGKLLRNVAMVSGFYRLVKLARLLGITPIEGVLLVTVLGGPTWLTALAGKPNLQAHTQAAPNVLMIIQALHDCILWCRAHDLDVRWMLQQVTPPSQPQTENQAERQLFEQVRNLLAGALLTHSEFMMAGVPSPGVGVNWLDLLGSLVSLDGLVITNPEPLGSETDYATVARARLLIAVEDGLGEDYAPMRGAIVESMLAVLLRIKAAQLSVVKECLAVHTGLGSEQVIPVLTWASGRVDSFLRQVLARPLSTEDDTGVVRVRRDGDVFLLQLAEVRRRSEIVRKLELSVEVLQDYLEYGNTKWLSQSDPLAVTLNTFYALTVLARAFSMSEQPQARLLAYLREAAALPEDLTPGMPPRLSADAWFLAKQAAAARLAQFFGWSVQDVLECAATIGQPVLRNLQHLDLLTRMRRLAASSGMAARTIFMIGALPANIANEADKSTYREAAERALLSLSETAGPVIASASETLIPSAKITWEMVSGSNTVIAGKSGEKVTFKVTVTDMQNRPMSGVFVHWQCTLGTIAEEATDTANGEVLVDFVPGKVQGDDTPLFWLDMQEKQPAGVVSITHDADNLSFSDLSEVPTGPVPAGIEVELYAVAKDNYRNLCMNATVNWSVITEPAGAGEAIVRYADVTNSQGLARALVTSVTGGKFRFRVMSTASSGVALFDAITFLPPAP